MARLFAGLLTIVGIVLLFGYGREPPPPAPQLYTLNAELGGVPVTVPVNRITTIGVPGTGESLDAGIEMEKIIALASQQERLPISGVTYLFHLVDGRTCAGPDWLAEECVRAVAPWPKDGDFSDFVSLGPLSIHGPTTKPQLFLPKTRPAADGSLTRTELGGGIYFAAVRNGRIHEAACDPPHSADNIYGCRYWSSDGRWNWLARFVVAEAGLEWLPDAMLRVDAFVDRLRQ